MAESVFVDVPDFIEKSVSWNPWHGCHKVSEGCRNCYMFLGDVGRGVEGSDVVRRSKSQFNLPLKKDRNGLYTLRDKLVLTTMTSDFFIEDAAEWRDDAWSMIRRRADCTFEILTKRPQRIIECLPSDWGSGYRNVRLSVSVENQRFWDERVSILIDVPAIKRDVFLCPMIGPVDTDALLSSGRICCVYVGGELYKGARLCDVDWVTAVRESCVRNGVSFIWRNCGSNILVDGQVLTDLSFSAQSRLCASRAPDHIVDDPLPRTPVQRTLF